MMLFITIVKYIKMYLMISMLKFVLIMRYMMKKDIVGILITASVYTKYEKKIEDDVYKRQR